MLLLSLQFLMILLKITGNPTIPSRVVLLFSLTMPYGRFVIYTKALSRCIDHPVEGAEGLDGLFFLV